MGSQAGVDSYLWSTNSDKWSSLELCWRYNCWKAGGNQLIMNWINCQAVMTTRNPEAAPLINGCSPGPGATGLRASSGDFWVRPPSAQYDYAWEDTSGVWHQMSKPANWALGDTVLSAAVSNDVYATTSSFSNKMLIVRPDAAGRLHVDLPKAGVWELSVIDMRGRTLISRTAQGNAVLDQGMLGKGIYLVRASGQGVVHEEMLTLAR
jgi:hypothetical protein